MLGNFSFVLSAVDFFSKSSFLLFFFSLNHKSVKPFGFRSGHKLSANGTCKQYNTIQYKILLATKHSSMFMAKTKAYLGMVFGKVN